MHINRLIVISSLIFLVSCGGEAKTEEAQGNELEQLDELMEAVQNEPEEELQGWAKYFDLKVPPYMSEMTELNREAIAQFGYVAQEETENGDGEVFEHYLIVMMEEKAGIEGYPVEVDVDVMSYRDDAIRSLEEGDRIEKFVVLNEPLVEQVNGMDCVKNQMDAVLEGRDESIELYYQLGIYEGNKAFYQVLTWCVGSQKAEFAENMELSLNSFREK